MFISPLRAKGIPTSFARAADVVEFLGLQSQFGEWQLQGLPTDPHSTQNAVILTKSPRPVYCIDPQRQALRWVLTLESQRLAAVQKASVTDAVTAVSASHSKSKTSSVAPAAAPALSEVLPVRADDAKLKDKLESALRTGGTFVLTLPVSSTGAPDSLVDSVLSLNVIMKGKSSFIMVGEHLVEFDPAFRCG